MEKQRICKIYNKWFSNGKVMEGHMRSHLAKFPLPPKPQSPPQQQHHQLSDSPDSSSLPFLLQTGPCILLWIQPWSTMAKTAITSPTCETQLIKDPSDAAKRLGNRR
ncbi:hypothetical protein ACFX2H_013456 [Malus domestica]